MKAMKCQVIHLEDGTDCLCDSNTRSLAVMAYQGIEHDRTEDWDTIPEMLRRALLLHVETTLPTLKIDAMPCSDCGRNTVPDPPRKREMYMVTNEVWRSVGMDPDRHCQDQYLCIGCLETRLGRKLTPQDFSPARVNAIKPSDTARLTRRKR